jgi:hypothetical protein
LRKSKRKREREN